MTSFFGLGKKEKNNLDASENSQISSDEKGIIGRYYEDNFPVIVKFVNEFPEDSIRTKFPILTVVSWKYNGEENNGMPLKDVNKKMIVLEDALEDAMDSSGLYQHAYSRTGNNLKEFVYYCTKQDEFMDILNKSLVNHEKYPINIDFYEDEQWNEFRQLLDDFINKD